MALLWWQKDACEMIVHDAVVDQYSAFVRRCKSSDAVERKGLAGTGGSKEDAHACRQLTIVQIEGKSVERLTDIQLKHGSGNRLRGETVDGEDNGESEGGYEQHEDAGEFSVSGFDGVVNGYGERLRATGNVARDHNGDAEIA